MKFHTAVYNDDHNFLKKTQTTGRPIQHSEIITVLTVLRHLRRKLRDVILTPTANICI